MYTPSTCHVVTVQQQHDVLVTDRTQAMCYLLCNINEMNVRIGMKNADESSFIEILIASERIADWLDIITKNSTDIKEYV